MSTPAIPDNPTTPIGTEMSPMSPSSPSELTLALDIGGTKVAAGLVDDAGEIVQQAKLPTPDGDAEAVWAVVDTLVTEALAAAGGRVRGGGISSPGPLDPPAGTPSPLNITEWQGFSILERGSILTRGPRRLGRDGGWSGV